MKHSLASTSSCSQKDPNELTSDQQIHSRFWHCQPITVGLGAATKSLTLSFLVKIGKIDAKSSRFKLENNKNFQIFASFEIIPAHFIGAKTDVICACYFNSNRSLKSTSYDVHMIIFTDRLLHHISTNCDNSGKDLMEMSMTSSFYGLQLSR